MFTVPNVIEESAPALGSDINENLTSIQTELNSISNIATYTATTENFKDDSVTGNKMYIDSVFKNYDCANKLYVITREDEKDSKPAYVFDTNYIIGQVVGQDDLIWDSGNWAETGSDVPTWADAPEFVINKETPSGCPAQWRSAIYAVRHSGLMRLHIKVPASFDTYVALMAGHPSGSLLPNGDVTPEQISDFVNSLNNNGTYLYSTYYREDSTSYSGPIWQTEYGASEYFDFYPLYIGQLGKNIASATTTNDVDIIVHVPAGKGGITFLALTVYNATYYDASTRFIALSTNELEVNQVRYLPIGKPESGETLIEKAASYYQSDESYSTGNIIWYSNYIYTALQNTTGNAPTGTTSSNSYWHYERAIGS